MNNDLAIIIMAAGKGTRMKDPSKAKVMYEIYGKPMLQYVVETAKKIKSKRIIVIVGYQKETVIQYLNKFYPDIEIVIQEEQLGTGHAVMTTEKALENFIGNVLILSGDVPLLTSNSINKLIELHFKTNAKATILTTEIDDPTGYGRIIRNQDGTVRRIVEEKDANEAEKKVKEINTGIYVFEKEKLFESLKYITPQNAQKEYYLTDVFENFSKNLWKISALKIDDFKEVMGINTIAQLEEVRRHLSTV